MENEEITIPLGKMFILAFIIVMIDILFIFPNNEGLFYTTLKMLWII